MIKNNFTIDPNNNNIQDEKIEEALRCPLSLQIMAQPYIANDGRTYELEEILQYIGNRREASSPEIPSIKINKDDLKLNERVQNILSAHLRGRDINYWRNNVFIPLSYERKLIQALLINNLTDLNGIRDILNLAGNPCLFIDPLAKSCNLTLLELALLTSDELRRYVPPEPESRPANDEPIRPRSGSRNAIKNLFYKNSNKINVLVESDTQSQRLGNHHGPNPLAQRMTIIKFLLNKFEEMHLTISLEISTLQLKLRDLSNDTVEGHKKLHYLHAYLLIKIMADIMDTEIISFIDKWMPIDLKFSQIRQEVKAICRYSEKQLKDYPDIKIEKYVEHESLKKDISYLKAFGAHSVYARNEAGETFLHTLAQIDYRLSNIQLLQIEELLNEKEVENYKTIFIKSVDNHYKTALHRACEYKNINFIKFLLEQGAEPNILDGQHLAPLDYVLRNILSAESSRDDEIYYEIAQLLLNSLAKISPLIVDSGLYLQQAIEKNKLKLVDFLITNKINIQIDSEFNALQLALIKKRKKIVEYFLNKEIFLKNVDDIIIAINFSNMEFFKLLMDNGYKDYISKHDKHDQTPLLIAYNQCDFEIAYYLIDKGADPSQVEIQAQKIPPINDIQEQILANITSAKRNWPQRLMQLSANRISDLERIICLEKKVEELNSTLKFLLGISPELALRTGMTNVEQIMNSDAQLNRLAIGTIESSFSSSTTLLSQNRYGLYNSQQRNISLPEPNANNTSSVNNNQSNGHQEQFNQNNHTF